jgi:hypothetical protein
MMTATPPTPPAQAAPPAAASSIAAAPPPEPIIWRRDLPGVLRVSSETIRRWMLAGRIPPPDKRITTRMTGWRRSTLRAAGLVE